MHLRKTMYAKRSTTAKEQIGLGALPHTKDNFNLYDKKERRDRAKRKVKK